MKTLRNLLTLSVCTLGFTTNMNAQATASSLAKARIVAPISIINGREMNFGNIAVASTAGSVILSPASARTAIGGVTLPVVTGTVASARFEVIGEPNYTFAITLPATHDLEDGAGNSMQIYDFTSNPSATGTLSAALGNSNLEVGATIDVAANQPAGQYESVGGVGFDVTVNYN